MTRLDTVFSALSHPARRAIVDRLAREGESTVGAIASGFDVSLNQVSKHLKILERALLIRRERVGREHRLRLDPIALLQAREWLDGYRAFWEETLDGLERYLDYKDSKREEHDDG